MPFYLRLHVRHRLPSNYGQLNAILQFLRRDDN
jgi:hypothetical protein